jgi:hypothetical protein
MTRSDSSAICKAALWLLTCDWCQWWLGVVQCSALLHCFMHDSFVTEDVVIECPISALGPFWVLRILKILHPWSTTSHGFAGAAVEGAVELKGLQMATVLFRSLWRSPKLLEKLPAPGELGLLSESRSASQSLLLVTPHSLMQCCQSGQC